MSKRIGIFGDSFADPMIPWQKAENPDAEKIYNDPQYDTIGSFSNNVFKTWTDLLEADTYGYGGSDLYYSVTQFEKYHHLYEKVIFVLTNNNNRLTMFHKYWETDKDWYRSCNVVATTGASMAEMLARKPEEDPEFSLHKQDMYSKAKNWHEFHAHSGFVERENTFSRLILERIKTIRPDVKIIKAFHWYEGEYPHIQNVLRPEVTALIDLVRYENKILGWDEEKMAFGPYDIRPGHFTNETHSILATLIRKWIETKTTFFYFNLEDFKNIKPDEKMYSTKQGINKWVNYITKNYNNDK